MLWQESAILSISVTPRNIDLIRSLLWLLNRPSATLLRYEPISISMRSLIPSYFSIRENSFTNLTSSVVNANFCTSLNIFLVRRAYTSISFSACRIDSSAVESIPVAINCNWNSSSSSSTLDFITNLQILS